MKVAVIGSGISGTDQDQSLSVDFLPKPEADAILSRTAAWKRKTGKAYDLAFVDVRKGDSQEASSKRRH
jgi:hypothetical protein